MKVDVVVPLLVHLILLKGQNTSQGNIEKKSGPRKGDTRSECFLEAHKCGT
jgi:hypothetical protein